MSQNTTGATPFPLGVFVGNPNYYDSSEEASFEATFNAFSTLMGAKPQFLDQYADQRLPISQWVGQASWNAASVASSPVLKDVTPVIGLPMTSTAPGSQTADQFYKDFAAGTYDSVLKDMVNAWADNGFTTQIWRPGWEMNVSTMPSYAGNDAATHADWVEAFQHIYTVLHAAGQANGVTVQVMWNPDVVNYSNAGNVIQTAYPGNQYVDIVGADIYADAYPYGSPTHLYDWDKSGQVLNSSNPVYDTSVQQWAADPVNLQHYYTYPASNQWSLDGSVGHATTLQQLIDLAKSAGKPLAIAETGAGNTHDGAGLTDNPTFVQWLSQTLHQSGVNVSFASIWNSNSGGEYHFTSAADGKPLEAAAWAKYFGAASTTASTSATTASSASPGSQAASDGISNTNHPATTPPAVPAAPTIASYSNDSGVAGDRITNDNTLELKGTAAAGSTVKISDGATQIGSTTADSTGSWHYITKVLTDAKHTLTATATNSSAHDAPVLLSGSSSHHRATVTGTSGAGSTIRLEAATLLGPTTTGTDGHFSVTTSALKGGSHTFAATGTDASNHTSALSQPLDPNVGSQGGNATSTVEITNAHQNWNHTARINGTADHRSTVSLYDGTTSVGVATAGADGSWSFRTSDLSNKNHTLTANEVNSTGQVVGTHSDGAIFGTSGSNTLTGTAGNDVFIRSVFDSFASVLAHASQPGHEVVISTGSDTLGSCPLVWRS
jgi:hypothetical protein